MNSLLQAIDKLLKYTVILMMSAIILAVLWQVFSRYVLQTPSSGSEELARFLLIWISLLGAVYSFRQKLHLGLHILVNKLSIRNRQVTQLVSLSLIILFSLTVLVYGGVNLVNLTFNPVQISPALGLHIGYVYSVLPIAGVLMSLYALGEVASILSAFYSDSEGDSTQQGVSNGN
ncbi:MAG: TRAP transporter small permease [Kangiellaceae bacterium]|nr:TRAP transporter small permease [Kangiellaceae bacterium]